MECTFNPLYFTHGIPLVKASALAHRIYLMFGNIGEIPPSPLKT